MRVATEQDHISHAVLGNQKAMDFGISDDPAFFQILSQSLYKDPMLAMVREVICNAWDSHIQSGNQDKPIKITLDDNNFIVEDFGLGIPHDMIQPIYGVYGASTKKNDGRQTGGFGLGSKSPFAYNDHFEVTSTHDGKRTIYSMSRSSAQVAGKPGITPIASFPNAISGVKVRVPKNPTKDNVRFHRLIRTVVFNGDIKAELNGEELDVLGLDVSEAGVVLVKRDMEKLHSTRTFQSHTQTHLRYGNVVYPIESHEAYDSLLARVVNISRTFYNCDVVIQAEPDTISVTPSRESLTMSDMTVNSIKQLLLNFLASFSNNPKIIAKKKALVTQYIDSAVEQVKGDHYAALDQVTSEWAVPGVPTFYDFHVLKTTDDFAEMHAHLELTSRRAAMKGPAWVEYINQYMQGILKEGLIDQGMYDSWLRAARKNARVMGSPGYHYSNSREIRTATRWWWDHVGVPMINRLQVIPGFNLKSLGYYHSNSQRRYEGPDPIRRVRMMYHTSNLKAFAMPLVVVSHDSFKVHYRVDYTCDRMKMTPVVNRDQFFHYQVSKKAGDAEAVLEALQKIPGILVLDLTVRLPHEEKIYQAQLAGKEERRRKREAKGVPVRKNRQGMVRIDQMLTSDGHFHTDMWKTLTDPEKLKEPAFVEMFSASRTHVSQTYSAKFEDINDIILLFGTEGGITNNVAMYDRYKKAGSKDMWNYVVEQLLPLMDASPTIRAHYAFMDSKIEAVFEQTCWATRSYNKKLLNLLATTPELSSLVPYGAQLSREDRARIRLWQTAMDANKVVRTSDMNRIQKEIQRTPLDKDLAQFVTDLCANPLVRMIDVCQVESLLHKHQRDPQFNIKPVIDSIISLVK